MKTKTTWLLGTVGLVCLAVGYILSNLRVTIVWSNGGVPRVYKFWLPDADERPVIARQR